MSLSEGTRCGQICGLFAALFLRRNRAPAPWRSPLPVLEVICLSLACADEQPTNVWQAQARLARRRPWAFTLASHVGEAIYNLSGHLDRQSRGEQVLARVLVGSFRTVFCCRSTRAILAAPARPANATARWHSRRAAPVFQRCAAGRAPALALSFENFVFSSLNGSIISSPRLLPCRTYLSHRYAAECNST